jgi:hypothetical protein
VDNQNNFTLTRSPYLRPKANSYKCIQQTFCENAPLKMGKCPSLTRFSTSGFFRQTIPLGPLAHGLKQFPIYLYCRFVFAEISTMKIDSALCYIARSRFCLLDNHSLYILFYWQGLGKITNGCFLAILLLYRL